MSDDRIEDAIRRLGSDSKPPTGWEDRVLADIAKDQARAAAWFALKFVACAALIAALVLWLVGAL